jgi:hypothetical protein
MRRRCIPEGVESKFPGVEIKTDRAAGEIDNERRERVARPTRCGAAGFRILWFFLLKKELT